MHIIFTVLIFFIFTSSVSAAEIIWRDNKGYIVNKNQSGSYPQQKGVLQPKDWKAYSFQKQQKTLRSSVTQRNLNLDQVTNQRSKYAQKKYVLKNTKSIHSGFSEKNLKKLMSKREKSKAVKAIPSRIIADKMVKDNRFVTSKDFGINDNRVIMPRNNVNNYRRPMPNTYKMSNNTILQNRAIQAPIKLYNPR